MAQMKRFTGALAMMVLMALSVPAQWNSTIGVVATSFGLRASPRAFGMRRGSP